MALGKLKGFLGMDDGQEEEKEVSAEDEYYQTNTEDSSTGVDGRNKMILFEPRAYSESTQIVDFLKKRNTVVVNLKRVTPDQAKRIADFLQGSLYAMNGSLQKLGGGNFLCAPSNMSVEGKITDDAKASKSGKDTKDKDDEFNW